MQPHAHAGPLPPLRTAMHPGGRGGRRGLSSAEQQHRNGGDRCEERGGARQRGGAAAECLGRPTPSLVVVGHFDELVVIKPWSGVGVRVRVRVGVGVRVGVRVRVRIGVRVGVGVGVSVRVWVRVRLGSGGRPGERAGRGWGTT